MAKLTWGLGAGSAPGYSPRIHFFSLHFVRTQKTWLTLLSKDFLWGTRCPKKSGLGSMVICPDIYLAYIYRYIVIHVYVYIYNNISIYLYIHVCTYDLPRFHQMVSLCRRSNLEHLGISVDSIDLVFAHCCCLKLLEKLGGEGVFCQKTFCLKRSCFFFLRRS